MLLSDPIKRSLSEEERLRFNSAVTPGYFNKGIAGRGLQMDLVGRDGIYPIYITKDEHGVVQEVRVVFNSREHDSIIYYTGSEKLVPSMSQGWSGPGWYFWDEIWTSCYGPYDTELEARIELAKYVEGL